MDPLHGSSLHAQLQLQHLQRRREINANPLKRPTPSRLSNYFSRPPILPIPISSLLSPFRNQQFLIPLYFRFLLFHHILGKMHLKQALGLLASSAALVVAEGDSAVSALTKDTFNDFIGSNDLVLAECKLSPLELATALPTRFARVQRHNHHFD